MATTFLSKTFSGAGTRTKYTISVWVKRAAIGSTQCIFSAGTGANNSMTISFNGADDRLYWNSYSNNGSNYDYFLNCTRRFRDVGAWYHIVCAFDSTQGTASNRQKIYINGVQETAFETETYSGSYSDYAFNNILHEIGQDVGAGSRFFDGSMTHFHGVDGTAYAPTSFGEVDSTSGIWKPKASPTGITYGTNGFFLKFANSGAMGTDSSGNSNTFAVGGGTLTQTVDTPDNNFATFNGLYSNNPTLSGANLIATASGGYRFALSTIAPTTGKYYAEFKLTTDSGYTNFGVANVSKGSFFSQYNTNSFIGVDTAGVSYQPGSSALYYNNSAVGSYGSAANGDVIGIAMDLDNGFIYWSKNGTFLNSGVPTSAGTGTGGYAISNIANSSGGNTYAMGVSLANTGGGRSISANFGNGYFGTTAVSSAGSNASGNGIFEYDTPTGYTALSTKGLNL